MSARYQVVQVGVGEHPCGGGERQHGGLHHAVALQHQRIFEPGTETEWTSYPWVVIKQNYKLEERQREKECECEREEREREREHKAEAQRLCDRQRELEKEKQITNIEGRALSFILITSLLVFFPKLSFVAKHQYVRCIPSLVIIKIK